MLSSFKSDFARYSFLISVYIFFLGYTYQRNFQRIIFFSVIYLPMKLSKNQYCYIVNYVKSQNISGFLWVDTLDTLLLFIRGKYCDIVNYIRLH